MSLWTVLSEHISATTGSSFTMETYQGVGGGCINSAYRLQGAGQTYFVKINTAQSLAMFEAEAAGLQEMADADGGPRVPQPVCWGKAEDRAYLVLEYVPLTGFSGNATELLGRQLALLHHATQPYFGWDRDNTIGSTPQINTPCENWVSFWRQHRLGFQVELAARHGYGGPLQHQCERLMENVGAFFDNYTPTPSLLHGDLWAGNAASDTQGRPVIFDPAVYYGDRETDLAMTELFGGFSARFYAAYQETYPLDAGYRTRRTLYNLYHILNHVNLFGGGYLSQAKSMLDKLLAELD